MVKDRKITKKGKEEKLNEIQRQYFCYSCSIRNILRDCSNCAMRKEK